MNYVNYHRHSYYSNIIISDSAVSPEDYAKRAIELNQTTLSSCEHGYPGRYIESYELAKQYGLKFLFGVEAYFVKDRIEKDKTNAHMVLLAKNENGRKSINRILSESSLTGFYYRPRIDMELLLSLPQDDVWVTSACLAGLWQYENYEELILKISKHFGENFFLEVQYHHTESQVNLNKKIIDLSNKHNINIIFGTDSHYIYPEQARERDNYLLSKHIEYEDEEGWFLDYPSCDETIERFQRQGVLNKYQIEEAINNTNIFNNVEIYDSIVFDTKMKLPTLYPHLIQEDRNKILSDLIWQKWDEEKINVPQNDWAMYKSEIEKELSVIIETGMADYFLLDYEIIKKGIETGGHLTRTGRGSGSSFYISKLLNFTTIDRISASVKLFPERFMTKERILETGSLPDFDFNIGNPEIFAQAQINIMGEDHSYPMITYGTLRPKAAWKLYARAVGIDFETANEMSEKIGQYEKELIYAEEEDREYINVIDFIGKEYNEQYQESTKYLGVVAQASIHACAYLLLNQNIKEEIGLIRIKDNICCLMDGLWAEQYSFLKNDLLKVNVVDLIHRVYKRIGIEPHQLPELIKICKDNKKVWDVYANAWTMGINQVEPTNTAGRVAKYKPKNLSEISAFVSAIRPGFKSNYKQFEAREQFSYGVPSLDSIIQTKDFPQSYLLYQENAMAVLAYAGIPVNETYDIIKNIAKKRVEKILDYKDIFLSGMTEKISVLENKTKKEAEKIASMTWQIIEDSSRYSFNACISGSTRILRAGIKCNTFQPTVEEMFKIRNNRKFAKATGHDSLFKKYKHNGYGNALSMDADGRIRKNRIINIYYSGKQKTYKIQTESGAYIVCTNNHKFPTPSGNRQLSDLNIGDKLYTKGSYEKYVGGKDRWVSKNGTPDNLPKRGQCGFQTKDYSPINELRKIRKNSVNRLESCSICGKEYNKNKKFELHHKNKDRTKNSTDDLLWLCNSCHKKEHYKMGRKKTYEKGIPAKIDKIISIEYIGKEMVYDIEMDKPSHNFISDSGLVTSNSHAYSVAGDSLYGAYLKSHYPVEFYEVLMNILEESGDKTRLSKVVAEAERAYDIKFPRFKFGQDNRNIKGDPQIKEITPSLKTIKGFGDKIGEQLYEIGQNKYNSFLDFLIDAEEKQYLSKKYESLIKIHYFSMFGGNLKLLNIFKEFTSGKNRYSRKHSDKTKEKRIIGLKDFSKKAEDQKLPIMEQIMSDQEILGYINTIYPDIDRRYIIVQSLDVRFAPRIESYCLANGKTVSLKTYRKVYDNNVFLGGDILFCRNFEKKNPIKYINGEYLDDLNGEMQYWLTDYDIIRPEDFNKQINKP